MIGALAVLSVVAIAGWVRKPAPASASNYPSNYAANPEPVAANTPPATASNPALDQYGQPSQPGTLPPYETPAQAPYATTATSGNACQYPAESALPSYASPHYVRTIHARVEAPGFYANGYVERPAEYVERPTYVTRRGVVYEVQGRHHRRSTGKSVAIVAGSAGVGAAIGGIAGGGKGAGIGALAGGAGGFIYDRLTRH